MSNSRRRNLTRETERIVDKFMPYLSKRRYEEFIKALVAKQKRAIKEGFDAEPKGASYEDWFDQNYIL